MSEYRYTEIASPFCKIVLVASSKGLIASHLQTGQGKRKFTIAEDWQRDDNYFIDIGKQIGEYFAGKRQKFELILDLQGTAFQQRVWQALCEIPFGEVRSYKDISMVVKGDGKACRAVGMANSRNPLPLIVPCHRVIGADGRLTGFAHGLTIKEKLLKFESEIKI